MRVERYDCGMESIIDPRWGIVPIWPKAPSSWTSCEISGFSYFMWVSIRR